MIKKIGNITIEYQETKNGVSISTIKSSKKSVFGKEVVDMFEKANKKLTNEIENYEAQIKN